MRALPRLADRWVSLLAISDLTLQEEDSIDTDSEDTYARNSSCRCVVILRVQQEGSPGDAAISAATGRADGHSGREPSGDSAGTGHDADMAYRQRNSGHD